MEPFGRQLVDSQFETVGLRFRNADLQIIVARFYVDRPSSLLPLCEAACQRWTAVALSQLGR
jgi:hypothetical protein